jgi:hypothetical protein
MFAGARRRAEPGRRDKRRPQEVTTERGMTITVSRMVSANAGRRVVQVRQRQRDLRHSERGRAISVSALSGGARRRGLIPPRTDTACRLLRTISTAHGASRTTPLATDPSDVRELRPCGRCQVVRAIRRQALPRRKGVSAEVSRGESERRRLRDAIPFPPASPQHRAIVGG